MPLVRIEGESSVALLRAKSKFALGQRVKLTQAGIDRLNYSRAKAAPIYNEHTLGTVTGFSHDGGVRILRDGLKTCYTHHPDFWEVV